MKKAMKVKRKPKRRETIMDLVEEQNTFPRLVIDKDGDPALVEAGKCTRSEAGEICEKALNILTKLSLDDRARAANPLNRLEWPTVLASLKPIEWDVTPNYQKVALYDCIIVGYTIGLVVPIFWQSRQEWRDRGETDEKHAEWWGSNHPYSDIWGIPERPKARGYDPSQYLYDASRSVIEILQESPAKCPLKRQKAAIKKVCDAIRKGGA